MPEETTQPIAPPEIFEVLRTLVTAIRIVRLYPPNNPVYSRTVKEAHEFLSSFLQQTPECCLGIQKTYFSYANTPIARETEANKTIASDLFTKGMRDMTFKSGVTEEEMLQFLQTIVLSREEIALQGGISSILWGKNITRIKITEAELDGIIKVKTGQDEEQSATSATEAEKKPAKDAAASGRKLILDDLLSDSALFSSDLLELAKKTKTENETIADRLFVLCREMVLKIQQENPSRREDFLKALAQSVLELAQPHRDALIAGKLYAVSDSENLEKLKAKIEEQLPADLHEMLTGRFFNEWNIEQISQLLKKSLTAKTKQDTETMTSDLALPSLPLFPTTSNMIKELSEFPAEEAEELQFMNRKGDEQDVMEAASRTLIALLPLIKNSHHDVPNEIEIARFSAVVRQLEEISDYFVKIKDYEHVARITAVFHTPVEPAFRPRMLEALKKRCPRISSPPSLPTCNIIKRIRMNMFPLILICPPWKRKPQRFFWRCSPGKVKNDKTIEKDSSGFTQGHRKNQTALMADYLSEKIHFWLAISSAF